MTTPLDLELWTPEVSPVSWINIWFGWVDSSVPYLPNLTTYGHETCIIGYSKDFMKFKRVCINTVTTPSDLELWTREVSHVSWIWFGWDNLGQVDFAETKEMENRNGKHWACSQVPSCTADLISDAALVHVFFESVSAPVLSGTLLPRFPHQGRLFGGSFSLLLDVWV